MRNINEVVKSMEAMLNISEEELHMNRTIGLEEVHAQKYDMSEMDMLEAWLENHDAIYERKFKFDGEQICVYSSVGGMIQNKTEWDVICHCGSYGHEEGLLEYYNPSEFVDVLGYMTAEDIIKICEDLAQMKFEKEMMADERDQVLGG